MTPDRPPEVRVPIPGERSRELTRRLTGVESRNVTYVSEDFPVSWVRAEGAHVWDADGNRLVDLTAGFGVASVGHRHPRVVEAVRAQAETLIHGMGDVHPPAVKVELLEALARRLPVSDPRIVLGTSGSEAVEVAVKTARLHTGRPGVLAFTGAYHGLTYGALAVTDRDLFRRPFRDQLNPHVLRAGYPHPYRPPARLGPGGSRNPSAAALRDVTDLLDGPDGEQVGAVIVEPVQGRGGVVAPGPGFLRELASLCRGRGILLVLDEIYAGLGRTGHWFACQEEGVVPDLLCVGKSLAGGMPLSACVGRKEVMEAWPPSGGEAIHTSTFLGHPLACAAALAALEVLEEEELPRRAGDVGESWREELADMCRSHDAVGDVRGRGLMVGIDLVRGRDGTEPDPDAAGRVMREALRRGWIVLGSGPEGNVLSLSPPLNVPETLLERATVMLDEVLEAATGGH